MASELGRVRIKDSQMLTWMCPPNVRYWGQNGHGANLSVRPLMTHSRHPGHVSWGRLNQAASVNALGKGMSTARAVAS